MFEANLSVAAEQGHHRRSATGNTMTSIGAPGRGAYSITLGRLSPGAYTIRVFEVSAKDGARSLPSSSVSASRSSSQRQRPAALSTASAAGPALEDRSTVSPSRTVRAPAASNAATSSGVMPPSGPTTTRTSPASGSACAARLCGRVLVQHVCRGGAADARGQGLGGDQLGDDRHAGPAGLLGGGRHGGLPLAPRLVAPRSPRHWTMLREACHGTTSSTPNSVAASIAWSSRSPLARACTRTNRGWDSGSRHTSTTLSSSSGLAGGHDLAGEPKSRHRRRA